MIEVFAWSAWIGLVVFLLAEVERKGNRYDGRDQH